MGGLGTCFGAMKVRWLVFCGLLAFVLGLNAGPLARFKMSPKLNGTMDVELYDDKPATVANFVAYVKSGAWHDCVPHRWVSNFILQGGSQSRPFYPSLIEPIPTNANNQLIDNRIPVTPLPPIPFEANVGRKFSNLYGTIAMARAGTDLNSATTDWFFNLSDNLNLDGQDGGYTVFGHLLRGTNVLNQFKGGSSNGNSPLVYIEGGVYEWIHMDITLLTVQIARVTGGNEISWDSVEGKNNLVEFSTVSPPAWQTAATVAGTGARLSVTNDPGSDVFRMYRVRVDFSN
jgi:cyclophilin family peptidyl-prolyl cis-trans isomerase